MSQVNLLIIVNIGILEMVLLETFRIFRPGMVGASGMGLSYWFAIFLGHSCSHSMPFLIVCVFKSVLLSATVQRMVQVIC